MSDDQNLSLPEVLRDFLNDVHACEFPVAFDHKIALDTKIALKKVLGANLVYLRDVMANSENTAPAPAPAPVAGGQAYASRGMPPPVPAHAAPAPSYAQPAPVDDTPSSYASYSAHAAPVPAPMQHAPAPVPAINTMPFAGKDTRDHLGVGMVPQQGPEMLGAVHYGKQHTHRDTDDSFSGMQIGKNEPVRHRGKKIQSSSSRDSFNGGGMNFGAPRPDSNRGRGAWRC